MAVTVVSGSRPSAGASTAQINQDKRIVDMRDKIFLLEPSASPLTLLTNKAMRKSVSNPEFKWLEQAHIPAIDRINGGNLLSSSTSLTVDNGAYFRAEMTVKVQRTGEVMRVTGVSSNTLTVSRSWGGTAAAALVDNDSLTILGSMAQAGASSQTSWGSKSVTKSNYTEIVRNPFEVTGTNDASSLYGGNDLEVMKTLRGIEHAKAIELKLLFGEKAEETTGHAIRSTGGIYEVISTNSDDFGGAFSLEELFTSAETMFRYGSDTKVLFCGAAAVSAISSAAAGRLEMVPSDKAFGININRLMTPHGDFLVVKHHLFEGDTYKNLGIVVDLDNIGYSYLNDRDTKLMQNIQTPGADVKKYEWFTEMGFFRAQEETHGLITSMA